MAGGKKYGNADTNDKTYGYLLDEGHPAKDALNLAKHDKLLLQ